MATKPKLDRVVIFDVEVEKDGKTVREFGWRYRSGNGGRHSNMGGPGESYQRKPALKKNAERITHRILTEDRVLAEQHPHSHILLVDESS